MILNGWKEIANYMSRGVRTVQRWEKLGLPLHRPNSRLRSAVVTTSEELDHWLANCFHGRTLEWARSVEPAEIQATIQLQVAKATAALAETRRLPAQTIEMLHRMTEIRVLTRALKTHVRACGGTTALPRAKTAGRVA